MKTHIETLRHSVWGNLKNIPHTQFSKVISPIDCLDMISQTSSGQTFLKHLQIDVNRVAFMRVMDGVVLQILGRLRGLHSVSLKLYGDWAELMSDSSSLGLLPKRDNQCARDFLLLIKEELSHIKKISIEWILPLEGNDAKIADWITDELEKRNEAWAPPLPSYKNFRRTLSPLSIMNAEVAQWVVKFDDKHRSKNPKNGFGDSEELRGVF